MPVSSERNEQQFDAATLIEQLERSMSGVPGIEDFVGAGAAFVKGEETDINVTVERMMAFFNGDIGGNTMERQRLVLLAQTMRKSAGGVPIFMLTFTTCSTAVPRS
jgi:hypothetical protein